MSTKLMVSIVIKNDRELADSLIEEMNSDQIIQVIRQNATIYGEQLFNFLSDYFFRKKNEAVLPAIHELCTVHIPHLPDMELRHLDIAKKAIEYYPKNKSYRKLVNDFSKSKEPAPKAKPTNWKVSFKHKKKIFDGIYDPADKIMITVGTIKIPLEAILQSRFVHLEKEIGKEDFETIVTKGKLVKNDAYNSYQTADKHFPYYWKNEDVIIVISFTELQPARYMAKIEFTCHSKL